MLCYVHDGTGHYFSYEMLQFYFVNVCFVWTDPLRSIKDEGRGVKALDSDGATTRVTG